MEEIKISVIIPVYNAEKYLARCLDSALEQMSEGLEVICVDDGSTDKSPEILAAYSARDSRLRVFRQNNRYAGNARNRGMEQAGGKYLAFLDADDYYLPGAISALYEQAERQGLDMVKGSFRCSDVRTDKTTVPLYAINCSVEWPRRGKALCFEGLPYRLVNVFDAPWNGLYRREFLERNCIRFNGLRCVNDRSFFIDCLIHAERMAVVDTEIVCYRTGQDGSLIGKKPQYFSCCLDSYKIIREHCRDISPKLRRIILRQELAGVFGWYEQLRSRAECPEKMDEELRLFLQTFDEKDVGVRFLSEFPFREPYYRLRYASLPPYSRPSLPVRAFRCWREHGWRYTFLYSCRRRKM